MSNSGKRYTADQFIHMNCPGFRGGILVKISLQRTLSLITCNSLPQLLPEDDSRLN